MALAGGPECGTGNDGDFLLCQQAFAEFVFVEAGALDRGKSVECAPRFKTGETETVETVDN